MLTATLWLRGCSLSEFTDLLHEQVVFRDYMRVYRRHEWNEILVLVSVCFFWISRIYLFILIF